MKRKDLTGKRFGRYTVIEYVGTKHDKNGKNAKAQWKCQCDCGNIRVVDSASLLLGRSKSCGCLCREENSKRMKQQIKERGCYITRLQEQLKEANAIIADMRPFIQASMSRQAFTRILIYEDKWGVK